MSTLPIEMINTILSYAEKEYYWNKFVKQWRIRFIKTYMDSKLGFSEMTFSHAPYLITPHSRPYEKYTIKFCRSERSIEFVSVEHSSRHYAVYTYFTVDNILDYKRLFEYFHTP
jgi:hypothetical protein